MNNSEHNPVTEAAKREAVWRLDYRQHRYLEHATAEELQHRLEDVTTNAYFVWRDGSVHSKGDKTKWVQFLSHIFEEATLRHIDLKRPAIKRFDHAPRAAALWDKLKLRHGSYLLKFGKAAHMTALYEHGALRVFPAADYLDASLIPAIRDNELEFVQESIGATVQFPPGRDYSLPPEKWISVPVQGTLKHTLSYESACYIACFSRRYDFRLFDEFGYDACVVIRAPERFIDAVKACGGRILPAWNFLASPVMYRDPLHPTPCRDVLQSKHFRFTYQQEFRALWEPQVKQVAVDRVDFELGPLSGYSELLIL